MRQYSIPLVKKILRLSKSDDLSLLNQKILNNQICFLINKFFVQPFLRISKKNLFCFKLSNENIYAIELSNNKGCLENRFFRDKIQQKLKLKQQRAMTTSSLQNSQSLKSLNQDLHQTKFLSQHISNKFDQFATKVIDYIEEKDPQKRFAKMSQDRKKQTQILSKYNKKLLQKVAELQKKVWSLQFQLNNIKSHKPFNSHNEQIVSISALKIENPLNLADNFRRILPEQNLQIFSQDKKETLQQIQEMDEIFKEQKKEEQKQLLTLACQFQKICERLIRIIKLQRVTEGDLFNEQTLTVTISKQKYDLLLDFYFVGTPYLKSNQATNLQKKIIQNSTEQVESPAQKIEIWSTQELQKMFKTMAQKNGKSKEWKTYIEEKQSSNQKQLKKLKEIASRKISQEDQENLKENKSPLKLDQNMTVNSTQGSIINLIQKDLENNLFRNLKDLMKSLNFSQKQYDLFVLFDKKRQCDKLYDIDEFLIKFKNQTDLYEISEAYTVYLIKTINFLLINLLELLSASNPENLDWFKQKLTKNSGSFKERLFKVLEVQFTKYMQEKKKQKKEDGGTKQKSENIFDKEKELESELIQIVYRYKDLVKSSIFNQKSQINLTF